jgi:hypothetical protein
VVVPGVPYAAQLVEDELTVFKLFVVGVAAGVVVVEGIEAHGVDWVLGLWRWGEQRVGGVVDFVVAGERRKR